MMRKKTKKVLEPRYDHMIDHAFVCVHPPEAGAKKKKPPAMDLFIKDILHNSLQRDNLEDSIILVRKLNWDDKVSTNDYLTITITISLN
jgi:hypothetical protein